MKTLLKFVACMVLAIGLCGCEAESETKAPAEPETTTPAEPEATTPAEPEATTPAESDSSKLDTSATPEIKLVSQTVKVGCGSCNIKVAGVQKCELSAEIDGKSYLVTGTDVQAHKAGLCSSTKQATISGKVADGKLVATEFTLQ